MNYLTWMYNIDSRKNFLLLNGPVLSLIKDASKQNKKIEIK